MKKAMLHTKVSVQAYHIALVHFSFEYVVQACGLTDKAYLNSLSLVHTITHEFRRWVGNLHLKEKYNHYH